MRLDQVKLAAISGVGRSSISRYLSEKTEAGISDLVALADALETDVEWLLTGESATTGSPRARKCPQCTSSQARAERAEKQLAAVQETLAKTLSKLSGDRLA